MAYGLVPRDDKFNNLTVDNILCVDGRMVSREIDANLIKANAIESETINGSQIPTTGSNSTFVMTDGDQTINGSKTFTSAGVFPSISLTDTLNQITIGTGTTTTVTAPTPAATRTYTIPDAGSTANVILSSALPGTTTNSIQFGNPTASYTPATLDYFEVFPTTITFTSTNLSSPQVVSVNLVRLGNIVVMTVPRLLVSGSGATPDYFHGSSPTSIPVRFQPTISGSAVLTLLVTPGANDGANVFAIVGVGPVFSVIGNINVYNGVIDGTFDGTGQMGWFGFSMTWTIS